MTVYNFSAGPAAIPSAVKQTIADELDDWRGTGSSVMEISHRSPEFIELANETESLIRQLLGVSENHAILMIPGGARMQYAMLPMNLSSPAGHVTMAVNGHWGKQCHQETSRFAQVETTAPISESTYSNIPAFAASNLNPASDYFHYTSNETLEGVQWHQPPAVGEIPLCCDMTSDLMTRVIDVDQFGMIYASAQKNLGIAGLTLVIMRKDLIGRAGTSIPSMLNYQTYEQSESMYNTPPTFPWYVMSLVLKWIQGQGGLAAIERANQTKSAKLYDYIDASDFYLNKVAMSCRSAVNVPFWLADDQLNDQFLRASDSAGLKALKGHRAVGGMRASIYNAIPESGIDFLIDFMREFERTNG